MCWIVVSTYPAHSCCISLKLFRDLSDAERDSEEVECVPGPSKESHSEHEPLVEVELFQHAYRVAEFVLYRKLVRSCIVTCDGSSENAKDVKLTLGGFKVVTRAGMYRAIWLGE